jgi:predicted PurR-regulated permease PerM
MDERTLNVSITVGTLLKTVLVVAGVAALFLLKDIVLIVVTAIVIATAVEPGVAALMRRAIPRLLSVIIVYLLVFLLMFGIFYFFLPSIFEEFTTFLASLPTYLETMSRFGALDEYTTLFGSAPSVLSLEEIVEGVRKFFDFGGVFGNALSAASFIFGGVFSFVLIVVFSFYFAVAETGVDDFLRIITPRAHQPYVLNLWDRSKRKIGLWMQGQLLLAVIMGVLVYLGLTILGVKHALILAVIAAVFEIIPVFGPVLAAVPAVGIAFVDGGLGLGLFTIALYVIAQQFENHLIYPLVVTRVVGVPPLLVILALIIGAELAGFLGILLSVPAAAVVQELVSDIEAGRAFKETRV